MKRTEVLEKMSKKQMAELVANEGLSKSAKIKVLFDHGLEVKEIASTLNIRYNFAYNVLQNYINTQSIEVEASHRETKKDVVWALFDQGKKIGEVAKELKMNYNYVWKLRKEWEDAAVKEAVQEAVAK